MPTVLIVEDDADNRELLRVMLELWKYHVIEAADGIEALNLAETSCPDLILMDIKLPNIDGLETARLIRQSAKISSTPIIFLSGCAESKYRFAANEVGANDYLVKPLNFEKMKSAIAEQLDFPQID